MNKTTLFIPKKCKVGFQLRNDTFSGKLGYIIYHDGKVWRKEDSWNSWKHDYITPEVFEQKKQEEFKNKLNDCTLTFEKYFQKEKDFNTWEYYWKKINSFQNLDEYLKSENCIDYNTFNFKLHNKTTDESIKPIEFENIPTEGFVLNKKAGGYSSGWNHRNTYCRVYDPRGWEFEISIPNLLYILENTNSIKGKGLEGKFIYTWDGKDLVLVPENAPEFKEMQDFTNLQSLKVKKSELVKGGVYLLNDNTEATFLEENYYYDYKGHNLGKKLWFKSEYFTTIDIAKVKKFLYIDTEFANHLDKLAQDNSYKTPNVTYEELNEITLKLLFSETYSRYSGCSVYFKKGKLYKNITLRYDDYRFYYFKGSKSYRSAKELLENFKLFILKNGN